MAQQQAWQRRGRKRKNRVAHVTPTANGQHPGQSAGPPVSFQAFPLRQDPDWDGELASRFQKPTAIQLGCEIQLEVWQPGNPSLSCHCQ